MKAKIVNVMEEDWDFSLSSKETEEMGLKGKQLVKVKFSVEAVIGKLEALYKEVSEK